jgi:probable addiction module antidote protein
MQNNDEGKLTPFNIEDELDNMELVYQYIRLSFAENNSEAITSAIGKSIRSVGLRKIAQKTGLQETGLHKSFSGDRNPRLDTVIAVLNEMGFDLTIKKNKNFANAKTKAETRKTPRKTPVVENHPQAII